MAHKMPSISPYAAFFNNPIIIKDPDGEFGLVGFFVGFATDVAVQMIANSIAGKPIGDIDYGDAFISGLVGAVTGGLGNLGRVGRYGQKILTAAGIEGKVASTSIKITSVITEEGIKASIDLKVSTEEGEYVDFKTVFGEGEYAKDGKEAGADFIIGSTLEVFKGGSTEILENITTKALTKEEKEVLRKFKQTALGSKNNIKYEAQLEQIGDDIKFQEKVSEKAGELIGISEEQIKEKID